MILAAVVTAVGGIIVAVIGVARKQDSREHGLVMDMIRIVHISQRKIERSVEKIDDRLNEHLEHHKAQERLDNGRVDQK
jgi:hypothetical protein